MKYEIVVSLEVENDRLVAFSCNPGGLLAPLAAALLEAAAEELRQNHLLKKAAEPPKFGTLHLPGGPPGLS